MQNLLGALPPGNVGSGASGSGQAVLADAVAAGAAPEGGSPAGIADVKMAHCDFMCGPPRPLSELFEATPRSRPACYPCFNASRAIAVAAKKDPAAWTALDNLKKSDIDAYKAKVLAKLRICGA